MHRLSAARESMLRRGDGFEEIPRVFNSTSKTLPGCVGAGGLFSQPKPGDVIPLFPCVALLQNGHGRDLGAGVVKGGR